MLIGEQDEILIQRCVDEELSSEETRLLLNRLDALDGGWRTLACGLLEDRSLRRSLRFTNDTAAVIPHDKPPLPAQPAASAGVGKRINIHHWWSHPLTSMALCAAIAFVGGVLIPDFRSGDGLNVASTGTAGNLHSRPHSSSGQPSAITAADPGEMSYQLQMTPGGQMIDVPVYRQPNDLYRRDQNNPLFSRSGGRSGGQVQYILVPVEENRSIVIPVSEDSHFEMQ